MEKRNLKCPRCFLPLRVDSYEGVEIDFCDQCWGCWLDKGELRDVVEARALEFSDEETEQVLSLLSASKTGPRGPVQCPYCTNFMEQVRYSQSVELVWDRCPDDGLWLDAGELKKVQVEAEKSRGVQMMLVRKLKLA